MKIRSPKNNDIGNIYEGLGQIKEESIAPSEMVAIKITEKNQQGILKNEGMNSPSPDGFDSTQKQRGFIQQPPLSELQGSLDNYIITNRSTNESPFRYTQGNESSINPNSSSRSPSPGKPYTLPLKRKKVKKKSPSKRSGSRSSKKSSPLRP